MKRIVIWFVGVATLMPILLGPKSAYAWNDESHDLLSRESILFMLRSGDPSVRLAGAMLVSAGEGSRANADGTRAWRLSREAFNVDHYEDVAMHNTADTPVLPELVYQLFGQVNFTAYDHFLLWGKNTTGQSIEKYNHVVRMPNGEFETVKDFMRMEQHDDIPGYTLSADDSLRGGVSPTLDLAGQWIQRVGSSGFQKFCDKQVRELVKKAPAEIGSFLVDKIPVPYLGDVLKWVFSEVPGISDLASLLGDEIARAVGPKLAAWVSAMCPRMVGDWDESPALADLRINHSTIDRTDIDGIAMMDIRFHPADNLATLGVNRLRDARDFDPKQQFLRKGVIAKACKPRGGRGSDDGIGRTALCDRVLARETARAARLAPEPGMARATCTGAVT